MAVDSENCHEPRPWWACHEVYQHGLAAWALTRHGSTFQLKGVVHECAYVLNHNADPLAVLAQGTASLNPRLNHPTHDVLLSRGGALQLKDTVGSARTTARRAPGYAAAGVRVLGTPETVTAVSRHGVSIGSSGISTAHNEGVAARAGSAGGVSWNRVASNAMTGAAVGATIGALIGAWRAYLRYESGKTDVWDVVEEILREAFICGMAGGGAAAAGTVVAGVLPPGWLALLASFVTGLLVGRAANTGCSRAWAPTFSAVSAMLASIAAERTANARTPASLWPVPRSS